MEENEIEKLLIDEIRSLFEQLKEEEKGRYQPGTGLMNKLAPDNTIYCQTAEALICKAHQLFQLNPKHDSTGLNSTLGKEVKYVELHKYEYDENGRIKNKSLNELQKLMHNANKQISSDLWSVLGDIDV